MKELRDWLKADDPVAHEPAQSDLDVQRMRRTIVSAAESHDSPFTDWARGSWAVATVIVALTFAVSMSGWLTPSPDVRREVDAAPTVAPSEPGSRRQLQMIAPGGTRVIWIFNDDFRP
jgi:hypothetical protein